MRKITILALMIMIVCVGASGCVTDGGDDTTTPAPTTEAPTTTPAPTTEAPTTTPAPTTEAPTTTPAPTTTAAPVFTDTKTIDVSDVNGGFSVTLGDVGFFTHPKYGAAGPMTTHFRADLTVENLINAARSIYPNINCYIVDDQNGRWPVYFIGSPTYLSGEYSGLEVREGYVVFDEINTESEYLVFTIEIPTANLPLKIEIMFEYP